MIRYSIDEMRFDPKSVVTVGTFDGLHVAHQKILQTLTEKAKAIRGRSVAITFKPHPQEILGKKKVELLLTEEERVQTLSEAGVDEVCLIKFDRDFSLVTAEEFLVELVRGRIGLSELVLGYSHTFGRGAEGNVAFATKVGAKIGFKVDSIDAIKIDGNIVSTSNIKRLLKNGNLALANRMLGRPYAIDGYVIRGDARGRTLGYPTANLRLVDERILYPSNGVYIVEAHVEGDRFTGLASVGVRPTFEESTTVTLEVWISDFHRDIYGKKIRVSFIHRLRDELKFDSPEQLISHMDADKAMMNEYLVRTLNKQKQEF
ncbi:MAG TPA: bifunctional riboflavin kinase/FAD synthetase [Candidatus Kryptonia bacterium]